MSQVKRLLDAKIQSRSSKAKPQASSNGLFTFHPTVEQKEFLRLQGLDTHEVFSIMGFAMERGIKFSLGQNVDNGNFYAIAREGGVAWDTSKAVAVWHSDLLKAITGLAYYLSTVNPQFPSMGKDPRQMEFDW